jgi:exonuclease SbcD
MDFLTAGVQSAGFNPFESNFCDIMKSTQKLKKEFKMKIVHFADVHYGMENYGVTDPETGLSSRFADFNRSLDFIINYCLNKKNKIDLVLFCGDAYKTRDPSPTYLKAFSERIKKLADFLPVVLISGNHDLPTAYGKANTLDIFSALNVPGVYIATKPQIIKISAGDDILQIAVLPWMNKVDLLGNLPERSIEEGNKMISKKLGEKIHELAQKIDHKKPSLLAAHYSVTGAVFGSEQGVMIGRDIAINFSDLKNTPFNYIALGHLHKYQIIQKNPLTIYPGSIERIDFGEEKDSKGFIELTISKKKKNEFTTNFKFIPTPARKFISLKITIGEKDDPTKKVLAEIAKKEIKKAVVRVDIAITQEKLQDLEQSKVQKALSKAFFIAGINVEITDLLKSSTITFYKEDYSWQDLLDKYLKQKNISESRAKKIKEVAEELAQSCKED